MTESQPTADTELAQPDAAELRQRLGLAHITEVAAVLSVKVETLRTWRSRRTGPAYMSHDLYEWEVVIAWIRSRKKQVLDTEE